MDEDTGWYNKGIKYIEPQPTRQYLPEMLVRGEYLVACNLLTSLSFVQKKLTSKFNDYYYT